MGATWGGTGWDRGFTVAPDHFGNVYVGGLYLFNVDFDPGAGEDWHTAVDEEDAFLSKFHSNGDFEWARTWGGDSYNDHVCKLAVDDSGNIYCTGIFMSTVDFDPDPVGEDIHSSVGYNDMYLSRFDPSGDFVWVRTWGDGGYEYAYGAAVDGYGNAYFAGTYTGTIDFDPGPGVDNHSSEYTFLCKVLPNGYW